MVHVDLVSMVFRSRWGNPHPGFGGKGLRTCFSQTEVACTGGDPVNEYAGACAPALA